MTVITALPPAPNRGTDDAATFSSKADTFVAALQNFRTETNLVATEVNASESGATAAAAAASSSAAVAAWNGTVTSYTLGQAVWSGVNFRTYRLSIASKPSNGANTDPSIDTAAWALVNGTGDVVTTSVQTVTNKTLGNALGTAALPSYSFVGDTDTGAWSPAGNTYAVSTAGVERMRVNSTGNVGIGTTTPGAKLHVGAQTAMIGNLLPSLAVQSETQTVGSAETTVSITQFSSGISSAVGLVAGVISAGSPYFAIKTRPTAGGDSVERLRIDGSGNVGIGVSPAVRFQVQGIARFFSGAAGTTNLIGIGRTVDDFRIGAPAAASEYAAGSAVGDGVAYSPGGNAWFGTGGAFSAVFFTNNSEKMRLDSSGNLITKPPATPPTLANNGDMTMNLTSNTNLRISVRGSDGVTRVANITLA